MDGLFIGNPLDSYQDEAFASVLDCVLHQVVHQNGEQVVVSDQQARYCRFNLVLELQLFLECFNLCSLEDFPYELSDLKNFALDKEVSGLDLVLYYDVGERVL